MNEFADLLAACRRGESGAFSLLVERFLPHVRMAVRKKLHGPLRRRFDSHDFAQDVWASFFRQSLGQIDLPDERAMVAYLSRMAELKVVEEVRHQHTLAVGADRNVPLDAVPEPADRTPTASVLAMADDRWETLTAHLPDRERAMIMMLAIGHSPEAAGAVFGISGKTVRRLVDRLWLERPPGDAA